MHKIILMVDMGDLREGIFNTDEAQIFSAAEAILAEPALEFHGIGVNLTCYGGIIPVKRISADCLQLQTSCAKGILFPFHRLGR